MIHYAILKGKLIRSIRAEQMQADVRSNVQGQHSYVSNHLHLLVESAGEQWRCPVNVKSADGSEVWIKVRDAFTDHPILDVLPELTEGLTPLPERRAGKTLDYVREPLFDRTTMRQLPKSSPGASDDVQDILQVYCDRAISEARALVYVFGSFWKNRQFPPDEVLGTDQGVHDVHMNQGNDNGHRGDDGIWQDGGIVFFFPETNRYVGTFQCFASQVWATDVHGHRIPGAAEGPLAEGQQPAPAPTGGEPPVPVPTEALTIIAALINPDGADQGLETVTLFNASGADVNLEDWQLLDRANQAEKLTGIIGRNQAVTLTLSGKGAQLGNHGGSLRLVSPDGLQVASVTWTAADAMSGQIVQF